MGKGDDISIEPLTAALIPFEGNLAAPVHFIAIVRRADSEVHMQVRLGSSGTPHCRALAIRPSDEAPDVTGETLRRVPVNRLLRAALAAAAFKIEPPTRKTPPGQPRRGFPWTDYFGGLPVPRERFEEDIPHPVPLAAADRAAFYEQHAAGARQPRSGSPLTDENLKQVAALYREAIKGGDPPTQTVADAMHVARSTAARWVTAARKRGFLGPAMRGRGGEREEKS